MADAPPKVRRDTARLFVLDPAERLLLFKFTPPNDPHFWATPGGMVDPGEDHPTAARRELLEETGFDMDVGPEIAQLDVEYRAFWGEHVVSDERYYLVRTPHDRIDKSRHEPIEREIMAEHHWWLLDELAATEETIFPEAIFDMVCKVLKI